MEFYRHSVLQAIQSSLSVRCFFFSLCLLILFLLSVSSFVFNFYGLVFQMQSFFFNFGIVNLPSFSSFKRLFILSVSSGYCLKSKTKKVRERRVNVSVLFTPTLDYICTLFFSQATRFCFSLFLCKICRFLLNIFLIHQFLKMIYDIRTNIHIRFKVQDQIFTKQCTLNLLVDLFLSQNLSR